MATTKKKNTPRKKKPSTAKKARAKKNSKKLVEAEAPKAFWVTNGRILHSLVDLMEELESMENDHYLYHSEGEKNDFSVWVEEVLCDEECASKLKKAKNKKNACTIIRRHLAVYEL